MKKLLTTTTIVLALTATAKAADWTGFYLGAIGSYGQQAQSQGDMKGGLGGLTVGYNYHVPGQPLVIGIEADHSFGSINQTIFFPVPFGSIGFDADNLGTLRGRLGVNIGDTLLFASAGAAWARNTVTVASPLINGSDTKWHAGWAAGGGLEHRFAANWSAKIEYLHVNINNETYHVQSGGSNAWADIGADFDVFRAGVNYRF